jgi:hypothetical protein
MPQIQYSEKYYDDVYEYRYAPIRARRFPVRLDAVFDSHSTRQTAFAREVAGSPELDRARDGDDGDCLRDIGVAYHA